MLEDRPQELMQAAIDGELDATGQSELTRCVDADPLVAQQYADWRALSARLDAIPLEPAPADLLIQIRAALPPVAVPSVAAPFVALRLRRRWYAAPGSWRYAAAFAGVVLVAGLFFYRGAELDAPLDQMTGTLVRSRSAAVELDHARVDWPAVQGQLTLYQEGAGLSVAFEGHNSAPIQAWVVYGGEKTPLANLNKTVGNQSFKVALPEAIRATEPIEWVFVQEGTPLGQVTLSRAPVH